MTILFAIDIHEYVCEKSQDSASEHKQDIQGTHTFSREVSILESFINKFYQMVKTAHDFYDVTAAEQKRAGEPGVSAIE